MRTANDGGEKAAAVYTAKDGKENAGYAYEVLRRTCPGCPSHFIADPYAQPLETYFPSLRQILASSITNRTADLGHLTSAVSPRSQRNSESASSWSCKEIATTISLLGRKSGIFYDSVATHLTSSLIPLLPIIQTNSQPTPRGNQRTKANGVNRSERSAYLSPEAVSSSYSW